MTDAPLPARSLTLADLPPAVAARLEFAEAAPRRFRNDRLPAPVQAQLRQLWDEIVADLYHEVAGMRRTKAFGRREVERALRRVAERLEQAERAIIVTAVHFPLRGDKPWKHMVKAGAGGGTAAAVEEVAAFGTAGTATTIAIASAVVGEIFETYVAASARTRQDLEVQRSPDPAAVGTDLAEAAGYGESTGRIATGRVARDAASWLGQELVRRTASRFARGLVPVFGVGAGAGVSANGVRKVTRLPLRKVSEDEVLRLADQVRGDPDAYAEALDRFLALTRPQA